MIKTCLCAIALSVITASSALAGPYEEGQRALERQDYQAALKIWETLGNQGDAEAQFLVGELYEWGWATPSDFSTAFTWYQKSANAENADGQWKLGEMYRLGLSVPADPAEAAKWYLKAADQGNRLAQCRLAASYQLGSGVKQDYVEAYFWQKLGACDRLDVGRAQDLPVSHLTPDQKIAAEKRVSEWKTHPSRATLLHQDDIPGLKSKADQGDSAAAAKLWHIYENGTSYVGRDRVEATKWLRKAAETGDSDAQRQLGQLFLVGSGVERNKDEAVKWFRKAADKGSRDAQYSLGAVFRGDNNYGEAYFWFSIVAAGKSGSANGAKFARDQLAPKLSDDEKAAVDKRLQERMTPEERNNLAAEEAAKAQARHAIEQKIAQLKVKADQGDTQAQTAIGEIYEKGDDGIGQDYAAALKWYRMAADQGYAPAQLRIGGLYWNGQGVSRDHAEAMKWERKAADQGYVPALSAVASLYERGDGVQKDREEAMKWYRKAADEGDQESQWKLGQLYENDFGKEKDWENAYYWFSVAAAYNWSVSTAQHLTVEQKAAEDKKVKEWRAQHGEPFVPAWAKQFEKEALAPKTEPPPKTCIHVSDAQEKKLTSTSCGSGTTCLMVADPKAELKAAEDCSDDHAEQAKWVRMAAEQGDCMAQVRVIDLYEHGVGVQKDYAEALFWESVAFKYRCIGASLRGDTGNKDEILETHLTAEQIGNVQKRVTEWKPNPGSAK